MSEADPALSEARGARPGRSAGDAAGRAETAEGLDASDERLAHPATSASAGPGWLRLMGRCLAIAFVAGSFAFWAWAFSPWARSENPGRLDNREFAAWAQQRCGLARDAVNALPSARQASSRSQRADQVDLGTAEVRALVKDLGVRAELSLAAVSSDSGPADTELVNAWLDDWAVYIEDRDRFAARLRDPDDDTPDRELRFLLVDMTEGSTYTERMDGFARLNDMDACEVPGDV